MAIPIPSVADIRKWIGFWKKYKGKKVKVYLKNENFIGVLSAIVDNPSGLFLTDVSIPSEQNVEVVFVPLIAVTKIYIFKKASRTHE